MTNLLYKEFKLALHPTGLIFLSLSLMLLIPNYPYYVTFFYTGLALFFTCLSGRENGDIHYMLLLPVRKREIVKARLGLAVLIELAQIAIAVPVAVVRNNMMPANNAAGMEANIAFFGLTFLMLGIFNYVFFTRYYKDPEQVGKSFIWATVAVFVYMALAEASVHAVPFVRDCLDTKDPAFLTAKLIVLTIGLALYALLTLRAYHKSAQTFEKLDF